MSLRPIAKRLLPPLLEDGIRWIEQMKFLSRSNHPESIVPWSEGYFFYRRKYIREALANTELMDALSSGAPLPPKYGVGVDERCLEYPWLLAGLDYEPGVFLDAGSTLNHDFILDHPGLQHKMIHILTLAPDTNCFWQRGISYLFHDMRDIPVRGDYYDTIACLSTLEHIGCDNNMFTNNKSELDDCPEDFVLAMQELGRVLKPGGTLFLTVPYGVYRHFGTFQQFDGKLLSRAVDAFGKFGALTESFYRYTKDGWQVADAAACAECEYVEWIAQAWEHKQWPNPLPLEPDRAAAARAVACVRLIKG